MAADRQIHTARLTLRPFQSGDVNDALAYRNDAEFSRFLSHIPLPFTRQDADAFVRINMSEPWETSPTFAVVLGSTLIGSVNLEINPQTRIAMVGYAIGRNGWGQGIATEAAAAVILWGVQMHRLSRIWASTDVRHDRSQRVLIKLGMKRESVIAAHHRGRNGEWIDEVVYGKTFLRE